MVIRLVFLVSHGDADRHFESVREASVGVTEHPSVVFFPS